MTPAMFPNIPSPVIFAHRGASAYAPENTLAAFQEAIQRGVKAVEFDVKLSADNQVVIIHDQTVDRTTDGHGKVSELKLEEMRRLDAGAWFDQAFKGQRIPTLEEVFAAFADRLVMNVELTNYATPQDLLVENVCELVARFGLESRILFSSFFPSNLEKAARLLPEVPRGLLISPLLKGLKARWWGWRQADYQSVHPFFMDVRKGWVKQIHQRKKFVFVWTVNSADRMRRLQRMGVDGIFTDDPSLALQILGGHA
jgi:glycerophosphoryl diester phosphodiesterase